MRDALVGRLPHSLLPGELHGGLIEVFEDFLVVIHVPPIHLFADRDDTDIEKSLEPERVMARVDCHFTGDRVEGRGRSDHSGTLVGRGIAHYGITVVSPAFLDACPSGCIRLAEGCKGSNVALAE